VKIKTSGPLRSKEWKDRMLKKKKKRRRKKSRGTVITASQEVEFGRITVQGQPG
jgi:hypothetical protein